MRRTWLRIAKIGFVFAAIGGGVTPAAAVPGPMVHCHDEDGEQSPREVERVNTWLEYSNTLGMGTEREGPLGSSPNGEHAKHTHGLYWLSNWCVVDFHAPC